MYSSIAADKKKYGLLEFYFKSAAAIVADGTIYGKLQQYVKKE